MSRTRSLLAPLLTVALGTIGVLGLTAGAAQAGPPPAKAAAKSKNPVVVIKTSMGSFKVELYADKAPITVKNFLEYVDSKHYDKTIFHRVIPTFMVQGGGYGEDMKEKPTKGSIKNEAGNGLKNTIGTLAMARTPDPHSASAQFFVNVADNAFLDHRDDSMQGFGYAVFGKVIEGMDVVNTIKVVPTKMLNGEKAAPLTAVVIESIRRG